MRIWKAQIGSVIAAIDTQCLADFCRSIRPVFLGLLPPAGSNHFKTFLSLDGANQHCGGHTFWFSDEVQHPMHAVCKIDIGVAWRAKHHLCAWSQTSPGVTTLVLLSNVGFGFGDETA